MKIGLIGIGNMGRGMLKNILKSDALDHISFADSSKLCVDSFLSTISEQDRNRLLRDCSSKKISLLSSSVEHITNHSNFIGLSLPNEESTIEVLFGANGVVETAKKSGARPIVFDHGTFSREFILHNSSKASAAGVTYIDAPVSGGPGGASAGSLTIMAGGPAEAVDRCRSVWSLYSQNIFHFGDVGCGMAAKLINQALVGIHAQAACEAIQLASSMGIKDTETLQAMLRTSWGQSKLLDLTLSDYIRGQREGWEALNNSAAPLRNMKKDFQCISQSGAEQLPLTVATKALIDEACDESSWDLQNYAFVGLLKLLPKKK